MESNIVIKQIVVITDGCSNEGESPALAAAAARRAGIIVNAIGIIDDALNSAARKEVAAIAQAGDGIADFSTMQDLGRSIQALTRSSIQMTVEKAIQRQLSSLVGADGIAAIPPQQRGKIVNLWETLCEETSLRCLILLDTSGSMQHRLMQAEQSIREVIDTLQVRKGESTVAVAAFPGTAGEALRLITDFTADVSSVARKISGIKAGGNTPTGAAIRSAITRFDVHTQPVFCEYVV
jgi:Ca-activated chloride channel family protein